jgi:hypothetical protein
MTEISGSIIDQSRLLGLIQHIAGLGLSLRSITPLDTEDAEAAAHHHRPNPPAGVADTHSGANAKGP